MFSKPSVLVLLGLICTGLAAQAETYSCRLSDPSRGGANVKYNSTTKTVTVHGDAPELTQFQGLQGRFAAKVIDQRTASPALEDDTLLHFDFSAGGGVSLRFYAHKIEGDVTVAEFIASENDEHLVQLSDFPLVCCVGKIPAPTSTGFSCK